MTWSLALEWCTCYGEFRDGFAAVLFCSHTDIYNAIRHLPRETVGFELRKFVYEDVACLVEDFLFSRKLCCDDHMLFQCLREDDFDGVTYMLHVYVQPFHYAGTDFEQRLFSSALSVNMLAWLWSIAPPTLHVLLSTFLCCACEGRGDLLQFMCQTSTVPKGLLEFTLTELREVIRRQDLLPTPTDSTWVYWGPTWYYAYLDVRFLESVGGKVMQERRGQCIELLMGYRGDEVSQFSDVSSREFSDALRVGDDVYDHGLFEWSSFRVGALGWWCAP